VARAVNHLGFACAVTHEIASIRRAQRIISRVSAPPAGHGQPEGVRPGRGPDGSRPRRASPSRHLHRLQVIMNHSEENDTRCLGLVSGGWPRFRPGLAMKRPAAQDPPHGMEPHPHPCGPPFLAGVGRRQFYFVHAIIRCRTTRRRAGDLGLRLSFAAVIGRATWWRPVSS